MPEPDLLRVLMVHNFRDRRKPSGENGEVDAEVDALRALGHHVDVLGVENAEVTDRGTDKVVAAARGFLPRRWGRMLPPTGRYDVAHVHNVDPQWGLGIVRALRRMGLPVVQSLHNWAPVCANALRFRDGGICSDCAHSRTPLPAVLHDCKGHLPRSVLEASRLAARWVADSYDDADLTLAMSPSHADGLRALGFANPLAVHGNIVPFAADRVVPPLHRRDRRVVFAGRMTDHKGFDLFCATAAALAPVASFVAYGDGAQAHLAGPEVRMAGIVDPARLGRELEDALVVVAPARLEETFGRIVVEAAAAGAWVVASDRGGLGDLLAAGIPGTAVAVDAGAEALTTAVSDAFDLAAALHDDGAERLRRRQLAAVSAYSAEPSARRLADHYRDAMARYAGAARPRSVAP